MATQPTTKMSNKAAASKDSTFLVHIPKNDILDVDTSPTSPGEESPLILLQLPPDCSPHQLQHFLADDKRASLITDTASFSVQTLGTSNSLILLPPPSDGNNEKQQQQQDPPASKRPKTTTTARLLHKGNGASYLELRPRSAVPLGEWLALVQEKGPVIVPHEWARRLHVATAQVVEWLTHSETPVLPVYPSSSPSMDNNPTTTTTTTTTYTIVDPDDVRVCQEAILATLTECYGSTFETQPMDATKFVEQALERVIGDSNKYSSAMMLHCARQLCTAETTTTGSQLHFDVSKVHTCVACQVLQRKDTCDPASLLDQLQLELPGTNNTSFQDQWLVGHAVRNDDGDWVYLSASAGRLAWEDLWAVKSEWTREELDPYLKRLKLYAPDCPVDDLLAQHTVKDSTGVPVFRRK